MVLWLKQSITFVRCIVQKVEEEEENNRSTKKTTNIVICNIDREGMGLSFAYILLDFGAEFEEQV